MKNLNKSNFKKGDKIILTTPWNHLLGRERRNVVVDSYNVREWTILSIGKKELLLSDSDGNKGDCYYSDRDGNFLISNNDVRYYATNESEINANIEKMRINDKFSTSTFEIVNIRY